MDTQLESQNHGVVNNGSNGGITPVNMNSEESHGHVTSVDNGTSQGTNITSEDSKSISSHIMISAPAMGAATIVAPSATIDINKTNYDDDSSDISDYKEDSEVTESDYEESSDSSVNALTSVLSSTLLSSDRTTKGTRNTDAVTDVNANGNALVVAGCRMCMLYIMVPAGTNVCFRCGNSGLVHFGDNGQA